jgi:protein SCO1/2
MRHLIFLLLFAAILSGCKNTANTNAASSAKRFPFKGKVVSVDRTAKKATIDHEAVEGYMSAMTMEFPIHADWVWDDLVPGSEVRAELVVDNTTKEGYWLENIGIVAAPIAGQSPVPLSENIGKPIPDLALTNQDGKRISMNDFRGKALAITFIYARCPLPEFCIRMSTNFSDLANQLKADPELRDKIRLLSISFDPAHDTPEKLRAYGIGYLGNDPKAKFDIWQLATGSDAEVRKIADFFGLKYEIDPTDKAKINHSLRTAVITPEGKIAKVIPGTEWTPASLLKDLQATLPK